MLKMSLLPLFTGSRLCLPGPEPFPVIEVPEDAPEENEAGGTTIKFWWCGRQLLFKQSRENTGENWSEKIATELAVQIGLPTVRVELANWRGVHGIVTASFLSTGQRFVHAADLIKFLHGWSGVVQRLTPAVAQVLLAALAQPPNWRPPPPIASTLETFIGYLMLDAWICNEDRHAENWGAVESRIEGGAALALAPTFDHASSLGRELSAEQRVIMIFNEQIEDYVAACPSGLFTQQFSGKPLPILDAVLDFARVCPVAARMWLASINRLSIGRIEELFDRIPTDRVSRPERTFALELLAASRAQLNRLLQEI
jgi:hypothetical protein